MSLGPFVALAFRPGVIGPGVVLGLAAAGLYGLLTVSLVLTYRVSRTVGFVQGGIALWGTFFYWWLTAEGDLVRSDARLARLPGTLVVVATGAVIGAVYGRTVTGRRAAWPRVRLTTYSLGWLLGLGAVVFTVFRQRVAAAQGFAIPSVFGNRAFTIVGAVVTIYQVATLTILVVLIGSLSVLMARTRTGTFVRAIADDPEAGRWVGIPLDRVGTAVYGLAGAISGLAGVLLASTVGISFPQVLFVFLRAMTVSVLGGFTSMPLALAGCAVLGVGEAMISAEVFGPVSVASREIIIMGVLFALVFLVNRFRPVRVIEAAGL